MDRKSTEAERIIKAEKETLSIKREVDELRSFLNNSIANVTEESSIAAENQKLKYRLQILKNAAGESASNGSDTALYSVLMSLTEIFTTAVRNAFPDINVPVLLSLANYALSAAKGFDYQCNSALPILQVLKARGVKIKPSEVGEKIVAAVPPSTLIAKLDVAPAGFINITCNRNEYQRALQLILDYGVQPPRISDRKLRVVVDFSSPNIAKEMHVGHLRSTIIGESVCRLLEYLGHDVLRINHVGDWGTQFGMLIAHLQDMFPNYKETALPVSDLQDFYRKAKQRFDEDADFKQRAYSCVVKLQGRDPEYIKAWQLICDVSRREFQKVYDRLGIKLIERGESFYQERMEAVVADLEARKFLIEDEGRKVLWCDQITVPFTVVKSDGGFTYDTSDLATIRQRIEEERGEWLIYITDMGQSQHFEILRHAAVKIGYMDPNRVRMDHVGFGAVLGEDKKKFKTRSGETVRLVDLLDEGLKRSLQKLNERGRDKVLTAAELEAAQRSIAYGCIKYADLSHNRNHEYVFSFDKMLDDKGNTAVYLLYALTRIKAISRLAGFSSEQLQVASKTTPISLSHDKEWKLGKALLRFPDVLAMVCSTLCVHHLCEFVYEIACTFTEFYDCCYCVEKNAAGEIVKVDIGRLLLTEVTARILEQSFYILGLEPVSRM